MATSGTDGDIEDSSSSHLNLDIKSLVLYNLKQREGSWRYPYGYHRVFFGGCIVIGPVRSWWWLLELFLLTIVITFILEYYWYHLTVWIIGLFLYLVVFASSWKTLMTDPGIIKKPPFPEALKNAAQVAELLPPFGSLRQAYVHLASTEGGVPVRHIYCFRCHIWRPPDSGHCRICGCCQLEWDHHCPIYGGCVSKKNLASFHIMAVSIPVFVVYLLICSCVSGTIRYKDGRVGILSASFVADEILVGIVLALILPPLLTLLPCEKDPPDQPPDNGEVVKRETLMICKKLKEWGMKPKDFNLKRKLSKRGL